jgi:hypothetical protein
MGVFGRVERRLEGAVNGVFARAFKGDVQPVEIAARLQRELDSEAKLMSRDRRLVPNEFAVCLSQHDYDRLAPYGKTLMNELLPELKSHAQSMGYVFNGPIMIHLELDGSLPTGRFTVSSSAIAAPAKPSRDPRSTESTATMDAVPGSPAPRSRMVLEVGGVRHPLRPPGLVVGRGGDADVRINDPSVSRRHVKIRVGTQGDPTAMDIVDLGSTNGLILNGRRIQQASVGEGSRIEIGNTRMLIHTPAER